MRKLLVLSTLILLCASCNRRDDVIKKYPKCDIITLQSGDNLFFVKDTVKGELRYVEIEGLTGSELNNYVIAKIPK